MNPLDSLNDQKTVYVSIDGDDIGKLHGQAILSDDPQAVEDISHKINMGQEIFGDWAHKWDGKQISFGGDEGIWEIPEEALDELETIRKDYEYATGFTVSVGVGKKMSESGRALLVAKVKGKNQTIYYTPQIEDEINKIIDDAKSGHGTSEESKLAEAYLTPQKKENDRNTSQIVESSNPEHPDNNQGYDSGYKDDNINDQNNAYENQDVTPPVYPKPNLKKQPVIQEGTSGDVPECDRLMNEIPATPEDQGPEREKPAPKGYPDQSGEEEAEVSEKENEYKKPGDLKYSSGTSGEPSANIPSENATSDTAEEEVAQDMGTQDPPSPTESKDRENLEGEDTPSDFLEPHIENAKEYEQSLGQAQEDSGSNQVAMENEQNEPESTEELLDAHIENAKEMMDEQGISRPVDYNEKDGDMGLSEEESDSEPNISEVLKEGLDNHADSIQRDKIINMVGDALQGFKSQKRILDKAKEQAPELYNSCIKMLKAMIELCSFAGIGQSEQEREVNEIEGQTENPEKSSGGKMPEKAVHQEGPPRPPQQ
jgi:hypothetical protein